MRLPRFAEAFGERSFRYFFAGQVISNVGTWFQNLAISLIVVDMTGSAHALGLVTAAQFIPIVALSLPAGRLLRRVSPKPVLISAAVGSGAIVVVLALVLASGRADVGVICALAAVLGALNAFERVAAQALVHQIVDAGMLGRAVATFTVAMSTARCIGPGLAGVAYSAIGGPACLLINALSFIFVAASLLLVRVRPSAPSSAVKLRGSVFRGNRWFVTICIANVCMSLFSVNIMVAFTALITLWFNGDAGALGMVLTLNAAGSVLGGFLAAWRSAYLPRTLALSCLFLGCFLALNAFAPNLVVLGVIGPGLGAALGYYQGVIYAAAQSAVDRSQISRAASWMMVGHFGALPIGAILTGLIIDATSAPTAFLVAAVMPAVAAGIVALRARRG